MNPSVFNISPFESKMSQCGIWEVLEGGLLAENILLLAVAPPMIDGLHHKLATIGAQSHREKKKRKKNQSTDPFSDCFFLSLFAICRFASQTC